MKFADLAKQPGADVVQAEPSVKFAELAKQPGAEPVEPPGMFRTGLAHAFDTAALGTAPDLVDSQQRALTAGAGGNGPPAGALRHNLETDLVEGAKANPYSAAVGDIAGFVAGPGAATLPKALGAAGTIGAKIAPVVGNFVGQRVGRGLVGGVLGGLTSGAQTLGSTHDLGKAWEATKSGAGWGAAAMGAPEITAPVLAAKGLGTDDPVERASALTNAAALGIPTAVSKFSALGKPLQAAGQSARQSLVQDLIKELLPQETEAVKARNKATETRTKDIFREHRRAKSSLSSAPEGGTGTPSIPGQPDLEAQALGKLGSKVQDNFRYLRSKDDLGLKLTPEAEAGVKAILPDYEAQANSELGQFAEGKDVVLKRILDSLRSPEATAPRKATLPRNMGFDIGFGGLKPNPTAGYTPEPLPTAESLAPKANEASITRLQQMRQDRGIVPRLGGAAVKGLVSPLGGLLAGGSILSAQPELAVGGAAYGLGKGLLQDPVLATSVTEPVGKGLGAIGAVGDKYAKFLAGATGPVLQKKLEFLMKTDPEFRAQVEAQNGR